jgi:hypothetical protein
MACELDQARTFGQRALTIAAALKDVRLTITAHYYPGIVSHSLGDYRRAVDDFRTSVAHFHRELLYERFGPHSRRTATEAWAPCMPG